ncbi:MAG: F0F1 ATP synthase subunit A [Candidatus Pacebacteria bacterium]|nr:F0F1 ATP synthase subunit A [Candidatus Paceibacterota bacterium]
MDEGLHIALASERLFSLWGLPITASLLTAWLVIGTLLISAFLIRRKLAMVPGRIQAGIEMFFEYLLGMIESTLGTRALAERYFPLIATIFIFIFTANMFDFLPIYGTVGLVDAEHHGLTGLFHAVNADLNTTLALAIISFLVIEVSGIMTLGVLRYGSKFVNFKGGAMGFAVGLLELIGNLARLISFSFRLFGAIFAGHVLLLVIGTFVPLILPVPLMAFEMFIGLLQAAVFAILTMAFIKIAIDEPHGEANHKHQTTNHKPV